MKFVHTNIVSTHWKELADFYIQTFQCKIVPPLRKQAGAWLEKGTGLKDAALEGAHLVLPGYGEDGPTLEIYQYKTVANQEQSMPNTKGYGHIAFEVDSVEDVLDTLIKNGGTACGEITKRTITGVGKISFVYARDPEGNLIELQSWKKE